MGVYIRRRLPQGIVSVIIGPLMLIGGFSAFISVGYVYLIFPIVFGVLLTIVGMILLCSCGSQNNGNNSQTETHTQMIVVSTLTTSPTSTVTITEIHDPDSTYNPPSYEESSADSGGPVDIFAPPPSYEDVINTQNNENG